MNETTNIVECIHCGCVLPDGNTTPCPECGKTGRKISIGIADSIELADKLTWQKHREYYEKKPWTLMLVAIITLGAPFLGLVLIGLPGVFVGLFLGIAAFLLSLRAVTKVRESESVV